MCYLRGLTLDSNTGDITGIPTTRQSASLTVEVSDSDSPVQIAEKDFILDIVDILPDGRVDEAYYVLLWANLKTPPYSWRISDGSLPPGLDLTLSQMTTTATITGKPLMAGTSIFELIVSDSSTPSQTVTRRYTIPVYDPLRITNTSLANVSRTAPYSDVITASGGAMPYTYEVTVGTLPVGLALNPATGEITGTTNQPTGHSSTFTVTVTDGGNPSATVSKQLALFVVDPLVITTTSIPSVYIGKPYDLQLEVQGGVSPYSGWSVSTGSLPPGLTLNPTTGVIQGNPTGCGISPLSISVHDAAAVPHTASATFHSLDVFLTGSGSGSVNSFPTGISISTGSTSGCSAGFLSGSTVTLMPTPSLASMTSFEGWSVPPCITTSDNYCLVTMTGPLSVTALFNVNSGMPVRLLGSSPSLFMMIQDAYDVAFPNGIIQSQAVTFRENLVFDRPTAFKVKGGYDIEFKANIGNTTVVGSVIIKRGSVTVENLIIR